MNSRGSSATLPSVRSSGPAREPCLVPRVRSRSSTCVHRPRRSTSQGRLACTYSANRREVRCSPERRPARAHREQRDRERRHGACACEAASCRSPPMRPTRGKPEHSTGSAVEVRLHARQLEETVGRRARRLHPPRSMRTRVRMIVCVHLPRFELVLAAGGARALAGRALAMAPRDRAPSSAWERSPAPPRRRACAEGWRSGRRWRAVPSWCSCRPIRVGVAEAWEAVSCAGGIGAAVEPAGPGLAYFETEPCARCTAATGRDRRRAAGARRSRDRLGGERRAPRADRRRADALLRAGGGAHGALAPSARARSAPSAALARRARRSSCSAIARRPRQLLEPLERVSACARSASWRASAAPRWPTASGRPGVLAHRLACGEDTPLRPRLPRGASARRR